MLSTEDADISKMHHEFERTKQMPKMNPQDLSISLEVYEFQSCSVDMISVQTTVLVVASLVVPRKNMCTAHVS